MIRLFGHYVPRNTLLIAIVEALLLVCSLYLALLVLPSAETFHPGMVDIREAIVFVAVMLLAMSMTGLYVQHVLEGWIGMFFRLVLACSLGVAALMAMRLVDGAPELFSGTLAPMSGAIALSAISVERLMFSRWGRLSALRRRVIVLGTGSRAEEIDQLARRRNAVNSPQVLGFLATNERQHEVLSSRRLQMRDDETLMQFAKRLDVNEIVTAVRDRRAGGLQPDALLDCRLNGIAVTELSSFFEREYGQLRLESLNASWMIYGDGFRQDWLRNAVKRGFDLAASTVLLIIALPIMLLTALCILLTMGRPIFYKQRRVGRGGKEFSIYKFRSMCNDAEKNGARWASADDNRVTPVGRVIRKLRIDELPQIINVFRGDMSFVGPRPERPEFVSDLAEQIRYYNARHCIRPGITGWAQVRYPYGASVEDARENCSMICTTSKTTACSSTSRS
ncbi:MAG: TIGR03013 family XrtA/PEP-CTERM system glycosyltransferase [Aquisalimonadaceae bacterium]